MPKYLVIWVIDIEADNPTEAAKQALEIHRDSESIATVFNVVDQVNNESFEIDLGEP